MEKVLIVYSTKTGSTKNTGEYIKTQLEKTFIVDLKSVDEVIDLNNYSKVILGSPINGMKIIPEMRSFIEKNQNVLKTIPNYFFVMTYSYNHGRNFVKKLINKDLKNLTQSINSNIYVVGGVADKPMPTALAFIFGLKKDEPLDNRAFLVVDRLIADIRGKD